MSTLTPYLHLIKNDDNFEPWGGDVRHNWDLLDAAIKSLQDQIDIINAQITEILTILAGLTGLYGVATGTNTYSVAITGVTAYATGVEFRIKFTNANTTASTLNVNGLGAKPITKRLAALIAGDLLAGGIVELVYDGANFQVIGPVPDTTASGGPPVTAGDVLYGVASGTNAYALAVNPLLTSYFPGLAIEVQFTNANTGASSINVNGLGAIALKKLGAVALVAGDISADEVFWIIYDGTNFQLVGAIGSGSSEGLGNSTCILTAAAAQTVLATAVDPIDFDTEQTDPTGMHDPGFPSRIKILVAGVYECNFYVPVVDVGGLGNPYVYFRVNGLIDFPIKSVAFDHHASLVYKFAVNDYIEVIFDNSDNAGSAHTTATPNVSPLFSVTGLAAG